MNLASLRLITEDLKRLVAFYEGITSLKAIWLTDDFAELRLPAFTLAMGGIRTTALFAYTPNAGRDRDRTIIEFSVADVDVEFDKVKGLATEVVQAPTTMPWGNRSLLFRDPDGNLVNFFTRPGADALKKSGA